MDYIKALNNIFKEEEPPVRILKIIGSKSGVDVFGRNFYLASIDGYSKGDFVLIQNGIIIGKATPYTTPKIQMV